MGRAKKVVIVGGVAGGASCAARLRRQAEELEILLIDRGKYVSFANCGLPYYVGEVITDEKKLLVATPELFQERFNIQVRVETEVLSIDRAKKELSLKDLGTGTLSQESYDILVLSPGASPIKPPLPGIETPGIFTLRSIPDSRRIREWIKDRGVKEALVVGGGFVGLEMTENLVHKGLKVTLLELSSQVMPPMDPEMVEPIHGLLRKNGVNLRLGEGASSFEASHGGIKVTTNRGTILEIGMVVLAIGVRPETGLAKQTGLTLGASGGIQVDDEMRTNDPSIFALGDAVEVRTIPLGKKGLVPLAGPANRQGRIAADVIAGKSRSFRGVQGTAVCGLFGMTAALTGASEKALKAAGVMDYGKVYLHPGHHVSYYPDSRPIHIKLLFDRKNGKVLGFQAIGEEGVEKRVDVAATVLQLGGTVQDLEEAELCYAPQYGAAKDPVNVAGMIASNVMRGDLEMADWLQVHGEGKFLLDVRDPKEFASGHVRGAVNLPLHQLRRRLNELPRDREIWVYCRVGQRSYYASQVLRQEGFQVRNLSGGLLTYLTLFPDGLEK